MFRILQRLFRRSPQLFGSPAQDKAEFRAALAALGAHLEASADAIEGAASDAQEAQFIIGMEHTAAVLGDRATKARFRLFQAARERGRARRAKSAEVQSACSTKMAR